MLTPQGVLEDYKAGTGLWDGVVRSVDEKGVVIEINTDPLSPERTRTRRLDLFPPGEPASSPRESDDMCRTPPGS